jgi:hypothetical protein
MKIVPVIFSSRLNFLITGGAGFIESVVCSRREVMKIAIINLLVSQSTQK